jgi:hypothetical protein
MAKDRERHGHDEGPCLGGTSLYASTPVKLDRMEGKVLQTVICVSKQSSVCLHACPGCRHCWSGKIWILEHCLGIQCWTTSCISAARKTDATCRRQVFPGQWNRSSAAYSSSQPAYLGSHTAPRHRRLWLVGWMAWLSTARKLYIPFLRIPTAFPKYLDSSSRCRSTRPGM